MKATKIVSSLLATAAVLAVAAPAAQAETNSYPGKGTVNFTQDNTKPIVTPPGTDGPEITEPEPNPDVADLMIIAASPLDFNTHEVNVDGADRSYNVLPFATTDKATGDPVTMENFVKFRDLRTTPAHAYKVTATLTQNFKHTAGNNLDGAKLTFSNVGLKSLGAEALKPAAPQSTFTLSEDAADNTATVLTNASTDSKGYGVHDITFGTSAADAADAITLSVPGTTVLAAGDYSAVITWTINDTI